LTSFQIASIAPYSHFFRSKYSDPQIQKVFIAIEETTKKLLRNFVGFFQMIFEKSFEIICGYLRQPWIEVKPDECDFTFGF